MNSDHIFPADRGTCGKPEIILVGPQDTQLVIRPPRESFVTYPLALGCVMHAKGAPPEIIVEGVEYSSVTREPDLHGARVSDIANNYTCHDGPYEEPGPVKHT